MIFDSLLILDSVIVLCSVVRYSIQSSFAIILIGKRAGSFA